MLNRSTILLCSIRVVVIGLMLLGLGASIKPSYSYNNVIPILPEGDDFATQVLGSPWDMSDYAQVSQYINNSGMANFLADVSVTKGVFSARSTTWSGAFSVLFPGYDNALLLGKVGHNYPIDANKYHCLYIASKIDSLYKESMVFTWFANEKLNGPTGTWGNRASIISNTQSQWQLYKFDMASKTSNATPWSQAPGGHWQGLMIAPSANQTTWQIDWVRLTDCNSTDRTVALDWTYNGSVKIFIQPQSDTRQILVDSGIKTTPYQLDTQGLQAGAYNYVVERADTSEVLLRGSFQVNAATLTIIKKPSYTSGNDYATQGGTPWDMDPNSVTGVDCARYSFSNGLLLVDTPPGYTQTGECYGGGFGNPAIKLKPVGPANTSTYRYMTFRMNMAGPWQNVPLGMIARFIWYYQGTSGAPANRCWFLTYGIPLDVGWHTYTIDLWDPIEGAAGDSSVIECPPKPWNWRSAPQALEFSIKPNENILNTVMHEEFDWVRLTEEESVKSGDGFGIQATFSKDLSANQITYYYTTDRANPTMHKVVMVTPPPAPAPAPPAAYTVFLPSVRLGAPISGYAWDTTGVTPGEYYICIVANDGYNTSTTCSEAPVLVTP